MRELAVGCGLLNDVRTMLYEYIVFGFSRFYSAIDTLDSKIQNSVWLNVGAYIRGMRQVHLFFFRIAHSNFCVPGIRANYLDGYLNSIQQGRK